MKVAWNIVVVLVVIACLLLSASSVYPGVLYDLLFIASLFLLPVIFVVGSGTAVLIVLRARGQLKKITIPWGRVAVIAAILFGNTVLLGSCAPRRIAFAFSRPQFEPYVAQAPISDRQGMSLNKKLGVYHVDRYATDPRGGVYFRTYRGGDGLGPDCTSHGFVYKPNAEGTPFGAAGYEVFSLGSGWYWFLASDDWH